MIEIHETSFKNCYNLSKVECNGKFLHCFPFSSIKVIKIKVKTDEINSNILNKFFNLEVLELPSHIKNLKINLNKIQKLKCSGEQLEILPQNVKRNLQSIELYDSFITKKMLKNCDNIQNFFVPEKVQFENKEINDTHTTTIEDIINSDPNNKIYELYLKRIVNDIKFGSVSDYNQNDFLGEITNKITHICLTIKNQSKKKMNPHPVQCFAMLRLVNEILNSKGALAEIQTGEGKSYVISVVAIALVLYKKNVDIVTPNLELAFRDEEEQREYYQLFGIKSGVLCSDNGDKEFVNLYQSNFRGKKPESRSGFYTHVLDYPIIYSTNFNFQFLHLYSLFQKDLIRKRKFDVVLIDEVDNMLLDQMDSPAIIGNRAKFYNFEDILKEIFNNRDLNEDVILNKLKKYSKVSNLNLDIVKKCKKSARIAKFNELNVDYIIEDKKLIIIDQNTGFKRPKSRWSKYIHELCEIKENMKIEFPVLSYCCINQNIYFNLYDKIGGVTGTIGDINDQNILKTNYKINVFKVPRNKIRPKKIVQKKRKEDEIYLYYDLISEINIETSKGRPVLVIMDSLKHILNFQVLLNNQCNIISGINFDMDKKSIEVAGKEGQITLATSAGGRGVDIKLTKSSLYAGGLHVIVPFRMPNERCEIQAFGRCGRQGQPGSATIYRDFSNDYYIKTPEFKEEDKLKNDIQNKFNDYIDKTWPWLYNSKPELVNDVKFEFNSSVEKTFEEFNPKFKVSLVSFAYKKKSYFINDIYSSIIMSWSFFFNYLEWNIKEVDVNEEYKKYIIKLHKWIPPNFSLEKCFKYFTKKFHMESIIENILNPTPKLLKNVEINGLDYLLEQATKITKGLFNVSINFFQTDYEYVIYNNPRITCKISQSYLLKVENQSESYPIKNNIQFDLKSLSPKFSQEFFNIFKVDYSSSLLSIKTKLNNLVENGVVSVGFGDRKIQISISISKNADLIQFVGSILYTYYLNDNISKPEPAKVPEFNRGKIFNDNAIKIAAGVVAGFCLAGAFALGIGEAASVLGAFATGLLRVIS